LRSCQLISDQSPFSVRFEWGGSGLEAVGPRSDAIVIVDVLSFSTCVDVALARGASILPYRWRDDTAARYAREQNAVLAQERSAAGGYSLSPASLTGIPPGTRLVLPSPNGATLSVRSAGYATTLTACLRNCAAVAEFAARLGGPIAVIAAGEQWKDGSLRPAWEDFIGAGAIIAHLPGRRSPEAQTACDAFRQAEGELSQRLRECSSGRELLERGFAADLDLAAEYNVSRCVPLLEDGAFVAQ
jgi:2-phosphosulfolactate phosphatase